MQITIDIPDNLSPSIIQKYLAEFQAKLKKLATNTEFKINTQACLEAFEKITLGDKSNCIEIGDIDEYIEKLKDEIN